MGPAAGPVASFECPTNYFRIPASNLCLDISGNVVAHYHSTGMAPPGSGMTTPSPVAHPSGSAAGVPFYAGLLTFNIRGQLSQLPTNVGAVEARVPIYWRRVGPTTVNVSGSGVTPAPTVTIPGSIRLSLNNEASNFPYFRYGYLLATTRAEALFRNSFTGSGGYLTGGSHVNYAYNRQIGGNPPTQVAYPQVRVGNASSANFAATGGRLFFGDSRIYGAFSAERFAHYESDTIEDNFFPSNTPYMFNVGIGYQPEATPASGQWSTWRAGLIVTPALNNGYGVTGIATRNFGSDVQIRGTGGYFHNILGLAVAHGGGCEAPTGSSASCTGYFVSGGLRWNVSEDVTLNTTVSHLSSNGPVVHTGMNNPADANGNNRWYTAAGVTWDNAFGVSDWDSSLTGSWNNTLLSYEGTSAETTRLTLAWTNSINTFCNNLQEIASPTQSVPSDAIAANAGAPHNAMTNNSNESWILGSHGFNGTDYCAGGARFQVNSTSTYRASDLDFDQWNGLVHTSLGTRLTDSFTLIGAVEANYAAEWWVRTLDFDPNPALTTPDPGNPNVGAQNSSQIGGTNVPRGNALRSSLWWFWDVAEDTTLNGRTRLFFDGDLNPIAYDVAARYSHPGGYFGLPFSTTTYSVRYRSDNTATVEDTFGSPLDERLLQLGAATSWGNVQLHAFAAYSGEPIQAPPTGSSTPDHSIFNDIARNVHSFRIAYTRTFANTHVRLFNDQIPVRWSLAAVVNDCNVQSETVGTGNNASTFNRCVGGPLALASVTSEVGLQYQIFPQHTWTSELFVTWIAPEYDWETIRWRNQLDIGSTARGNLRFYLDQNSIWSNSSAATSHYIRATATYTF